jgi:hypothetical protein
MAQESIREHGDMDPAVLHKIDSLLALMSRHDLLQKAPEMLGSIYRPTEIPLRRIRMALYGHALELAAEISEELP